MKLFELWPRQKPGSLASKSQSRLLGWTLVAALAMFAAGVTLPILETRVLFSYDEYSLIGIAYGLLNEKDFFLAFVITAFSIVLPFGKLIMLAIVYTVPVASVSSWMLWLLEAVSKWAMLDVLVIALVIFSLKSAAFANAFTMPGVYFFAVAALLSHFVSGRIVKALETGKSETPIKAL